MFFTSTCQQQHHAKNRPRNPREQSIKPDLLGVAFKLIKKPASQPSILSAPPHESSHLKYRLTKT